MIGILEDTASEKETKVSASRSESASPAMLVFIGIAGLAFIFSVFTALVSGDAGWMAFSSFCLVYLAILLPRVVKEAPFGAWSVLVISAFPAVFLRGAFVLGYGRDDERLDLLLLPTDLNELVLPGIELAAGLLFFTFALQVAASKGQSFRPRAEISFGSQPQRVRRTAYWVFAISMTGFALFVQSTGGIDLSNLSAKRAVFLDTSDSVGFQNVFRTLAGTAKWAPIILMSSYEGRKLSRSASVVVASMALFAMIPPFYSSSRADLLFVPLSLYVYSTMVGRRPLVRHVAVPLLVLFFVVSAASQLRGTRSDDLGSVAISPVEFVESVAVNRNFTDPIKHGRAWIAAETSGRPVGVTYIGALSAPIPRAVWSSKPAVNAGPRFAAEAYGFTATGIPPGGVTELVWNFGSVGIVGALALGTLFGRVDRWFRLTVRNGAVPYAAVIVAVPTRFVGAGFSQATSGVVIELVIGLAVVVLGGARIRRIGRSR